MNLRTQILLPQITLSLPVALILGSMVLLTVATAAVYLPTLSAASAPSTQSSSEGELVTLTNRSRIDAGLEALTWNPKLYAAAQAKADHILTEQYFDHISPSGITPWSFIHEANYSYIRAGENLAVGFTEPNRVVNAWLASPTHRANVLDTRYTEIAVAESSGILEGESVTVIVQMFGQPTSIQQSVLGVTTAD